MIVPSHIIFPPEISFHPDIALLVYRPRGVLDDASVDRAVQVLGDLEAALKEPFDRFTDTLGAETIDLNFRHILNVSLFRRHYYSGRPPIKSAVLATDTTAIHYWQLHAIMTQNSPITVRVFRERAVAAKWLEVPIERLIATSEKNDP